MNKFNQFVELIYDPIPPLDIANILRGKIKPTKVPDNILKFRKHVNRSSMVNIFLKETVKN